MALPATRCSTTTIASDGPVGHRDRREQAFPRAHPGRASASAITCGRRRCTTRCCRWAAGSATARLRGSVPSCTLHRRFATPTVEITAANDELRREFEEMAALDAKPEEFGLRVRTSPAGLEITARNKMRRGTEGQAQLLRRHARDGHLRHAATATVAANFRASWSVHRQAGRRIRPVRAR